MRLTHRAIGWSRRLTSPTRRAAAVRLADAAGAAGLRRRRRVAPTLASRTALRDPARRRRCHPAPSPDTVPTRRLLWPACPLVGDLSVDRTSRATPVGRLIQAE